MRSAAIKGRGRGEEYRPAPLEDLRMLTVSRAYSVLSDLSRRDEMACSSFGRGARSRCFRMRS